MSIATVITQGYGSFGTVNFLPTIGYSSNSTPVVVTNDTFLPEDKKRFRKTPPGNIRFIYDKIKEASVDTSPLLEIIEPYIESDTHEAASESGTLPSIAEINYAALAANENAYAKFTTTLEAIREQLKIISDKQHEEDGELLLITIFSCTIN